MYFLDEVSTTDMLIILKPIDTANILMISR